MRDKKLQVFVSSTFVDLREERQAAVEAILSSGNIPAGMELFSAGNESQMTVIERWIDESDVYLLILGGRYGSIDKKTGKSYTQIEYEYAVSKNKPFFAVVISDKGLDEKVKAIGRSALEDKFTKELTEFRVMVLSKLVRFWDDTKDIKIAIHETLAEFSYDSNLIGWVRADKSVNTSAFLDEISRLSRENSELRSKVVSANNINEPYHGTISYSQLEKLLKKEKVNHDGKKIDLCSFLILKGAALSGWGIQFELDPDEENEIEPFEKLRMFKLVTEVGGTSNYRYKFTDGGHNFFLNTLATTLDKKAK